jgi:hypothetical protein
MYVRMYVCVSCKHVYKPVYACLYVCISHLWDKHFTFPRNGHHHHHHHHLQPVQEFVNILARSYSKYLIQIVLCCK